MTKIVISSNWSICVCVCVILTNWSVAHRRLGFSERIIFLEEQKKKKRFGMELSVGTENVFVIIVDREVGMEGGWK